MPLDAEPPPALRRARVDEADQDRRPRHRLLHAALRRPAHRRLRRLGRRQVVAAGDAGARAGFRHRGDRAGRRARPRGARISRRHARRQSRRRPIAVVSTGDESPMMRRLAPKTAMTVAEYFRDRGDSVLLIVDSVTRFAHAARDVALAAGEPAVARGYAPSVFSDLPRLLERAGPGVEGSRLDHRHLLGAGRRRRPQRSGRRQHSRHARRPYRARPRDRRPGPLSRRQHPLLGFAPRPSRLDARAAQAGRAGCAR